MVDNRYPLVMKLLHWVMGIAIIGMLIVGIYMEGLPKDAPNKYEFYGIHKAIGVLLLAFLAVRVVNRALSSVPALPDSISSRDKKLAAIGHALLYLFMLVMPVSGIVMSQAGGHPIDVFGWPMPVLIEKNKEIGGLAHEVHEVASNGLIALLVIHVAGVIYHRLHGVNLLRRMGF